jgi:hypothetical protein
MLHVGWWWRALLLLGADSFQKRGDAMADEVAALMMSLAQLSGAPGPAERLALFSILVVGLRHPDELVQLETAEGAGIRAIRAGA